MNQMDTTTQMEPWVSSGAHPDALVAAPAWAGADVMEAAAAFPSTSLGRPLSTSSTAPADASRAYANSQVPKAVFVDLSCLRERTLQGHATQLPTPAAALARPLRRTGGR